MKKILSLVLVVAMMASLVVLAPTASADVNNGFSVEVTDAIANRGEQVTLDIIVTTPDTFSSAQLAVDYDETRLANPVVANTSATNTPGGIGGLPYAGATINISAAAGAAQPAAEGCTIATITFDVLPEAPAGDAYVRIDPVPDNLAVFLMNTDAPNSEIFKWDSIEGSVTIFPEGYSAPALESDAADFSYTDNGDGSATITHYNGTDADVIIPSVIDGLTVKALGSFMFVSATATSKSGISSVTIPATVESIADYCMVNLTDCTDIYVLNPTVVIGTAALAYDAFLSVVRGQITVGDVWTKSADYVTPDTVIHGYAGSTADTYANTPDSYGLAPGWAVYVAPAALTVIAGDNTSTFQTSATSIVAPGAARVDGKVTVAWDVNGKKVAPGATVEITGDTTFTAITVAAPETTYGASVKAADDTAALRFTAELNVAEYDALVAAFGAKNVKHGMIISTQKNIEKAGAFTHAALGGAVIDFEMTGCWKNDGTNYILAASVKNFSNSTLANNYEFNAVAYIAVDVDADGDTDTYVYGDYDWTCARDAKTILTKALSDYDNESQEYGWINTWIGYFDAGKKD